MNWKARLFGNSREELLNFMYNVKCKLFSLHIFEWPLDSLICVFLTVQQAVSYIRVDGKSGHFIELLSEILGKTVELTFDCCHVFTLKVVISLFFPQRKDSMTAI